MHLNWWTLALQTLNFVVLVGLLYRFLYRPVLAMIDKRTTDIQCQHDEAQAQGAKARAELAGIEATRAGIAAEREQLLEDTKAQARAAAEAGRAQAEREVQSLLAGAAETIAAERAQALDTLRTRALELGATVALRLLEDIPAPLREQAWIERSTRHLQSLPPSQLDELRSQLRDGSALRVRTATATQERAQWTARLRELLGPAVSVIFETDRGLLAGAELYFPHATLRFSWRTLLEALHNTSDAARAAGVASSDAATNTANAAADAPQASHADAH